jgi:hypothetical protein
VTGYAFASAGRAAGVGDAGNAATYIPVVTHASAGLAAGDGDAFGPSTILAPLVFAYSGVASGDCDAFGPSTIVAPLIFASTGVALGIGVSIRPTITVDAKTYASANLATGTGVSRQPVANVSPKAESPGGTGEASSITSGIAPTEGVAEGTGASVTVTAQVASGAGYAAGTGAGRNAGLPNVPVWTSPPDGAVIGVNPTLVFRMPNVRQPMYFNLEITQDPTFATGVSSFNTWYSDDTETFEFWNGAAWIRPGDDGIAAIYAGNEARFNVGGGIEGTFYRRIRVGV